MILQEEFKKSGYKDILVGDTASEYEIDLEDIFELFVEDYAKHLSGKGA